VKLTPVLRKPAHTSRLEAAAPLLSLRLCSLQERGGAFDFLIAELEPAKLSIALQMLKQNVARQMLEPEGGSFCAAIPRPAR